eukprot:5022771-Amphidinium_carterae.1
MIRSLLQPLSYLHCMGTSQVLPKGSEGSRASGAAERETRHRKILKDVVLQAPSAIVLVQEAEVLR